MGTQQTTPEQSPRRNHGRLRLGIAAELETLDGRKPVRLVDLSQGGAQVIVPKGLEMREGVLSWLDYEVFCTAAWREGERAGLEFDEQLSLETLVETRNVAPSVIREESLSAHRTAREWVQGTAHLGSER